MRAPLLAAALAWAVPCSAGEGLEQLRGLQLASAEAAQRASADQARALSGMPVDGGRVGAEPGGVRGGERIVLASGLDPSAPHPRAGVSATPPPAPGEDPERKSRIPDYLLYGGAAVIGAAQGFVKNSWGMAVGGAILGVGAAFLYKKGEHLAAFGWSLGGVVAGVLGGPVAGIVGALVGAAIGAFVGKFIKF